MNREEHSFWSRGFAVIDVAWWYTHRRRTACLQLKVPHERQSFAWVSCRRKNQTRRYRGSEKRCSTICPHLVTIAAILFSRSFLSAFSSSKLNTSSRVIGPVKGFPSAASPPPIDPLEERRLSRLFRRSWPWKAGGKDAVQDIKKKA